MKDRIRRIIQLIIHKYHYLRVFRKYVGYFDLTVITHDLDKLIMYFLPLKTSFIRKLHKKHARHHNLNNKVYGYKVYREVVIDFECARFSKRKSKLNSWEYLKTISKLSNRDRDLLEWYMDYLGLGEKRGIKE